MTFEELEAQKRRLYERIKEVRETVRHTTDPDERYAQARRLRNLNGMYRDICGQMDALRPPAERRHKTPPRTVIHTGALTWDFFERCGTIWSDIDGTPWSELEAIQKDSSGQEAAILLGAARASLAAMTEPQRACVLAYCQEMKSIPEIAEERGVHKSTVSRVLERGLKRMRSYVLASLQARDCAGPEGFDFLRFAETTDILTERQREYLYLLLTEGVSYRDVAEFLDVEKSTVCQGNRCIEARLSAVSPGLPPPPARRRVVQRSEWAGRSEKEIAEDLGIAPGTYYRCTCRKETVGGIPRLAYEVLRLGDLPVSEAARQLGIGPETVRRYRRQYAGTDVSEWDTPERYTPRKRRRGAGNLRRLLEKGEGPDAP